MEKIDDAFLSMLTHATDGNEELDKKAASLLGEPVHAYTRLFDAIATTALRKGCQFSLSSVVKPGRFTVLLFGNFQDSSEDTAGEGNSPALAMCHAFFSLMKKRMEKES